MKRIRLKGKLVILRPLSLKDAPDFCRWFADPELTKFLFPWQHQAQPTLREERDWINESFKKKNNLNFAIDSSAGVHIGRISLKNIESSNEIAELGVIIGDQKYWGQGFGTEAIKLIIDYGFSKLKLNMIYLRYIAFNIQAEKSYRKVGFKPAGRYRQALKLNGFYHDECLMDLLRAEWVKARKLKK